MTTRVKPPPNCPCCGTPLGPVTAFPNGGHYRICPDCICVSTPDAELLDHAITCPEAWR